MIQKIVGIFFRWASHFKKTTFLQGTEYCTTYNIVKHSLLTCMYGGWQTLALCQWPPGLLLLWIIFIEDTRSISPLSTATTLPGWRQDAGQTGAGVGPQFKRSILPRHPHDGWAWIQRHSSIPASHVNYTIQHPASHPPGVHFNGNAIITLTIIHLV